MMTVIITPIFIYMARIKARFFQSERHKKKTVKYTKKGINMLDIQQEYKMETYKGKSIKVCLWEKRDNESVRWSFSDRLFHGLVV